MAQPWIEKLKQQEWAQDLQGRWSALDPTLQRNILIGALGGGLIAAVLAMIMLQSAVYSVRSEVRENEELTEFVQKSSEESRRMKGSGSFAGGSNTQTAQEFVSQQLAPELKQPDAVAVIEKRALPPSGQLQETLVRLKIENLSLRGLVILSNSLERPSIPLKLRAIDVESNAEKTALQVKVAVSEFQVIQK